jgi:alpha-D-ribose 1-methylphosphonate 5-phosphate C-P lyase
MFVCSDTDNCESRRAEGHRGEMAVDAADGGRA